MQREIISMQYEEKREGSKIICEQLKTIIEKIKPHTIITYHPLSDEVDISSITDWFQNFGSVITVGQDGSFESFGDSEDILALIP